MEVLGGPGRHPADNRVHWEDWETSREHKSTPRVIRVSVGYSREHQRVLGNIQGALEYRRRPCEASRRLSTQEGREKPQGYTGKTPGDAGRYWGALGAVQGELEDAGGGGLVQLWRQQNRAGGDGRPVVCTGECSVHRIREFCELCLKRLITGVKVKT